MRPPDMPSPIVLAPADLISPDDIRALCHRLQVVLEDSGADLVVCDVSGLADPDVLTVDALARLQLTARRLGRQMWLRHVCAGLQDLLTLTGLNEAVPWEARTAETTSRCRERS